MKMGWAWERGELLHEREELQAERTDLALSLKQREEQLCALHAEAMATLQRAARAEEDSAQLRLALTAIESRAMEDAGQQRSAYAALLSRLQETEGREAEWRRHDEEREEKWSEHRQQLRAEIAQLQHTNTHLLQQIAVLSQPTTPTHLPPAPLTPTLPRQPPSPPPPSLPQLNATERFNAYPTIRRPLRVHRSVSISESVTVIEGLSSTPHRVLRRAHSTPLPSRHRPSFPSLSPSPCPASADDCVIAVDVRDGYDGEPRTTNLCLVTLHTHSTADGPRVEAHNPRWVPAEGVARGAVGALLHHAALQLCRLCHSSALHSFFTTRRPSDPRLNRAQGHRLYRFANAYDPISHYHFLCAFLAQFPLIPGAGPTALPYFDSEPSTGACTDCEALHSEPCKPGVFPMWDCGRCKGEMEHTRGTCEGHWSGRVMHVDSGHAACCEAALTEVRHRWEGAEGEGSRQWMRTFDAAFPIPGPECRHDAQGRTDVPSLADDAQVDNALKTLAEHRTWLEAQGLTPQHLDWPAHTEADGVDAASAEAAVDMAHAEGEPRHRRRRTTTAAASTQPKRRKTERATARRRTAARPSKAAEVKAEEEEVGEVTVECAEERGREMEGVETRRRTRSMSRMLGQPPPPSNDCERGQGRVMTDPSSPSTAEVDLTLDDVDDPTDRLSLTSTLRTHSAPVTPTPLSLAQLTAPLPAQLPEGHRRGQEAVGYVAGDRRRRLTHVPPAPSAEEDGAVGHARGRSQTHAALSTSSAMRSTRPPFTGVPSSTFLRYTRRAPQPSPATPTASPAASADAPSSQPQVEASPVVVSAALAAAGRASVGVTAAVPASSPTSRPPLMAIPTERLLNLSNVRVNSGIATFAGWLQTAQVQKQKTPKRRQQNADLSNRAAQRVRR